MKGFIMSNQEKMKAIATEVQTIMRHRILDAGVPMEQALYEGWRIVTIAVKEILAEDTLAEEEISPYDRPFEQMVAKQWAFQLAVAGLKELPEPKFPGGYEFRQGNYSRGGGLFSIDLMPYPYDPELRKAEIKKKSDDLILKETRKAVRILIDAGISLDRVVEEVRYIVYELSREPGQEQITYDPATEHLIQRMVRRLKQLY